ANLGAATQADRMSIPYYSMEAHLMANGFPLMYTRQLRPERLATVTAAAGTPQYWEQVAGLLKSKMKTRGAAMVAREMEVRGDSSVSAEVRDAIEKVVALGKQP